MAKNSVQRFLWWKNTKTCFSNGKMSFKEWKGLIRLCETQTINKSRINVSFFLFILYFYLNQECDISTQEGTSLKLVDKFTYLGSCVSSTEKDIGTRLTKAWSAMDKLSIMWKSDLTDKMKRSLFQATIVSILLYGCTTGTLTKRLEKKLDGNYTRMLRAILNKSRRQHPTKH